MEQTNKSAERRRRVAAAEAEPNPAIEEPAAFKEGGIDDTPLDDILTREEIEKIYAEAKAKVRAEQKAARAKAFRDAAMEAERREAGLIPAETEWERYMAEPVQVYIDLPAVPGLAGRRMAPQPILIDQKVFVPGRTYTVPRAQAQTLAAMCAAAKVASEHSQGNSRSYYDPAQGRTVYQGGARADV